MTPRPPHPIASAAAGDAAWDGSLRYVPLGEMLTLGDAGGALSSLGDSVALAGPFAAAARQLVYALRMPTNDQRIAALRGFGDAARRQYVPRE